MVAVAAAIAVAFGRVFAGGGVTTKLLLVGVATAAVAWAMERRSLFLATVAEVALLLVLLGLIVFRDSTWFLLPGLDTLRAIGDAARRRRRAGPRADGPGAAGDPARVRLDRGRLGGGVLLPRARVPGGEPDARARSAGGAHRLRGLRPRGRRPGVVRGPVPGRGARGALLGFAAPDAGLGAGVERSGAQRTPRPRGGTQRPQGGGGRAGRGGHHPVHRARVRRSGADRPVRSRRRRTRHRERPGLDGVRAEPGGAAGRVRGQVGSGLVLADDGPRGVRRRDVDRPARARPSRSWPGRRSPARCRATRRRSSRSRSWSTSVSRGSRRRIARRPWRRPAPHRGTNRAGPSRSTSRWRRATPTR